MTTFNQLLPKLDERAVLIGMTGCGKTTLAEYILATRPRVIVYDTKAEIDWKGYQKVSSFAGLLEANHTHVHYVPTLQDARNEDAVNEFFKYCYEKRNLTVYVDEIAFTCTSANDLPFWLHGILSRGRWLNVSFIGGTQRPKRIPLSLFSEVNVHYIFKLKLKEDAKRIEETYGIDVEAVQALKFRQFYFGNNEGFHAKPLTLKIP